MNALESLERWNPVDAPITNAQGARSPVVLRAVVAQFDVVHNPRYRPEQHATWCNIFAWDVSRALQAEIPHWIADEQAKGGRRELNVNATIEWLEIVGPSARWREVDLATAALRAELGCPVVAIWKNPTGGHGHVAVLLPPLRNSIRIAQAGASCLFDVPLRKGFGSLSPIRFFTHE